MRASLLRRTAGGAMLLGVSLAASACPNDRPPAASTSTVTTGSAAGSTTLLPTTVTTAPGPIVAVAPLTGLGVRAEDAARLERPALAVKIDNSPQALPQAGLDAADIVWEIEVEGISRLLAVFHSSDAETVGPVRSARLSDLGVLRLLGEPLFAWSGANASVAKAVNGASWLESVSFEGAAAGAYERRSTRSAPHNLYTSTAALFGRGTADGAAPLSLFPFARAGETNAAGVPIAGLAERVGATRSTWVWDNETAEWLRWQDGRRHRTEDGDQLVAANVVVLEVRYTTRGGSPVAQLVGSGDATVLVNGTAVEGRWTRPSERERLTVVDALDRPIWLTPGTTWVELTDGGTSSVITSSAADALLAAGDR